MLTHYTFRDIVYLQQSNKRFYAMNGFCHLRKEFSLKRTAPLPL